MLYDLGLMASIHTWDPIVMCVAMGGLWAIYLVLFHFFLIDSVSPDKKSHVYISDSSISEPNTPELDISVKPDLVPNCIKELGLVQEVIISRIPSAEKHAGVEKSITRILNLYPLIFPRHILTAFAYWITPIQWMCYVIVIDSCDTLQESIKWKKGIEQKMKHISTTLRANPIHLREEYILHHLFSIGGFYPRWTQTQINILSDQVKSVHMDEIFRDYLNSVPYLEGIVHKLEDSLHFSLTLFHRWTFLLVKPNSKKWKQLVEFYENWASLDHKHWHHHLDIQLHRMLYTRLRNFKPIHTPIELQITLAKNLYDISINPIHLWGSVPIPEGLNALYKACVQQLGWEGNSQEVYMQYTTNVNIKVRLAIKNARDTFEIKHDNLAFLVLMLSLPEGSILKAYKQGRLPLYILQVCVRRRKPKILPNRNIYHYNPSSIIDAIHKRHRWVRNLII